MVRIDRIAQRRQLRRAAEQALLTVFGPEPSIDDQRDEDPPEDRQGLDDTAPLGIPLPAAGEIYTTPIDSGAVEVSAVPSGRWHHLKRGPIPLIAAVALAMAVTGVLLVVRHGDPGPEESTTDTPIASTSVVPAPSPTLMPPAPPPPSPSAASPTPAPVITQPYTPPDEDTTTAPAMPEIGVTRTPVTRAPFSASPSPMPPPQYDQGNGRLPPHHGCCGF